jgi:hypothetical protein
MGTIQSTIYSFSLSLAIAVPPNDPEPGSQAMVEVHYGVILQNGTWTIIGDHLRFGAYKSRSKAEFAARRLADQSSGLPVLLHLQDETGELRPPTRLN